MGLGHDHDRFAALRARPWLEGLDARVRLVGLFGLALAAATVTTREGALVALWAAFALVSAGGVPVVYVLSRLRFLAVFLVPLLVVVPFAGGAGGAALWPHAALSPTDRGLDVAVLIALRLVAASTFALVAVGVGPYERTVRALGRLGLPDRLSQVVLLSYRYLFDLRREVGRVESALAARGFVARPDRRTAQVLGQVVGGLLVRSLRRTERIDQAMRCRGYDGRLRSLGGDPIARPRDVALGVLLLAAAAALALADRTVLGR